MLAPMIREMPAAIEKNAVAEEMSRMRGREVKGTLQHEPDPANCSLLFAIIRWPVFKRKRPVKAAARGSQIANAYTLLKQTLAIPCPNEAMRLNAPELRSKMRPP